MDATKHPALFVVDVVASLGVVPFEMEKWGVNAVMGASQKGLMVPPGVGFCAADARAMEVCAANPAPRFYWDWLRRRKGPSYSRFCGTPPQNLLFGMQASFGLLATEGVANVHARHARLAGAVHAAVQSWSEAGNLQFLSRVPEARALSVTAVLVKPGIDPELIRKIARDKFQVMIAGGLGPFAGRVFRIGHLGDLNSAMILGCLSGVEAAMQTIGIDVGERGVRSAVEYLARTAE
jgi:alanine-glyoxylate transaminase/serine-glyoxylate transaminase/serine-pyruvate transaminase